MVKITAALLLLCACTACIAIPESYPVPPQRIPALLKDAPITTRGLLEMTQVETDAYIVQDIPKGETGPWRWAGARPTVRFYLTSIDDLKARVEYTVPDVTLKVTGPVTLRFLVNNQLLEQRTHKQQGSYTFDKPVPLAMLKGNADNELAVEVDKPFVSERDGAKLGFILSAIGLVR